MNKKTELEEALTLLLGSLAPLERENVPAQEAAGRVLVEDVIAPIDLPPCPTAALAGYAVRSADLDGARASRPVRLHVAEGGLLRPGEAIPVQADDPLPQGCDAVLPVAGAVREDGVLTVSHSLWPFDHFNRRGEDCPAGGLLLSAGTRLSAPAALLLAQINRTPVPVLRRPRLWIQPGGADSLLRIMAVESGAELCSSSREADLILAPVGTVPAGKSVFSGIRAEPCGDAALTLANGVPILTMPNTFANAWCTFILLVHPALANLTGDRRLLGHRVSVALSGEYAGSSPFRRFLPCHLERGTACLQGTRSPLSLPALTACNGLLDIPAGSGPLAAGQAAKALLLSE